jgi:polysaccharide export outer membrane protein
MKKMFCRTYLSILTLLLLASCGPSKNVVYFQDELLKNASIEPSFFELTYKIGDMLSIDVSALDPETVRAFNLPAVSYSNSVISAQGNLKMQTYLIDNDGLIQFPVLGALAIKGLSRTEAKAMLTSKLKEYIKDPIVNIRLANFSITVLGEVNRPGAYTIQDERVSLAEALGLAGDLTIYGRRENVLLIRETDGIKRFAKFDLTKINVLGSPGYYLTQNDVIYVEPNNAKTRTSQYTQNNSVWISAIGTLATIVAILIR